MDTAGIVAIITAAGAFVAAFAAAAISVIKALKENTVATQESSAATTAHTEALTK